MQAAAQTAPVVENKFVVGGALTSDIGGDGVFTVRRTRVPRADPNLWVHYGGTDSHLARLNLRPTPSNHQLVGGKRFNIQPRNAMETVLRCIDEPVAWPANHPSDLLNFDLPRAALKRWAEEADMPRFTGLDYAPGMVAADEMIQAVGLALLPYVRKPERAPKLFVDHLLTGLCRHLVERYGGRSRAVRSGGLAPWQEKRAKEIIDAHFDTDLSLKRLADECGISVAHFARAFRQSTGQTPHKWLVQRRIEHALLLLSDSDLPLASIAMRCGFSDQSHFTNVFSKHVGLPPGASRRLWTSGHSHPLNS